MNAPLDIRRITSMSDKGEVLIPADLRDRLGLVPGRPVDIAINDRGELVVLPRAARSTETREERAARIEAAVKAARALHLIEGSTDEIMRELRGDDPLP